jgi:dihydroorotase-like cyclic amidohydrolase
VEAAKLAGAPPLRSAADQDALWDALRTGDIQTIGSDADLVLFDPHRHQVIDERHLHSRAGYDPFHARAITGVPVMTLARGEVVAREGRLLSSPGRGQHVLRRRTPA